MRMMKIMRIFYGCSPSNGVLQSPQAETFLPLRQSSQKDNPHMSKSQDSKKETKKKPTRTDAEKKQLKKDKKAGK